MGLREQMNENPRVTTGITIAIIVLVLAWMGWSWLRPGGVGGGSNAGTQAFYTVDGKEWFADDAKKVPPFKKDGQEAYRAIVYKCGGKTFINHMERYTPEAQKRMEALAAKGDAATVGGDMSGAEMIRATGLEVKSPDGKDWVKISDPKAQAVMQPKCEGGGADLELVMP